MGRTSNLFLVAGRPTVTAMLTPLVLSFAWAIAPQEVTIQVRDPAPNPVVQAYDPRSLVTPQTVTTLERLALTPRLDGVIEREEWDTLALGDGIQSYFQWEPGKVHFAARLLPGADLLTSIDLKGDGWLVGDDNLEVRVRLAEAVPTITVRMLDATDRNGPQWRPADDWSRTIQAAAREGEDEWVVEVTVTDPGMGMIPREPGRPMGIRLDPIPPQAQIAEPYWPRTVAPCSLVYNTLVRGADGLRFNPEYRSGTSVVPGDTISIRFGFNGRNEMGINRISMRSEGFAEKESLLTALPFPRFDGRGRAFVDYNSPISSNASMGWRVAEGALDTEEGTRAFARVSYQIAPLVTFAPTVTPRLESKDEVQRMRFSNWMFSNTRRRLDGNFTVEAPAGWNVLNGSGTTFIIFNARGSVRRVYEVEIPAGAEGSFPFRLRATIGGTVVEQTVWVYLPRRT